MNFIKSSPQFLIRSYAFKSDLKIKWNRPEKVYGYKPEKSGDTSSSGTPKTDGKTYLLNFEKSKELLTAANSVKQLFQLENNPRRNTTYFNTEVLVGTVKRHNLDYGSVESSLAEMTVKIRNYQQYMEMYPRNKKMKVLVKELIDKRKKFLKYLRRWDYARFEYMLKKLDIIYKPPPLEFHWITRKESLVKLTDIHCEKIKTERLENYKKILQSKQLEFLRNKHETLEFMRKEQIECCLPVTVTTEQIQSVKSQCEELKKKQSN